MYTLWELETEKCLRTQGVMYTLWELETEKCVRKCKVSCTHYVSWRLRSV